MEEGILKISKVNKVRIKNYGIIREADIKFKDRLNIITGPNASGKTTVIRFLADKLNPENLSCSKRIMLQIGNTLDNQTILIDDILGYLNTQELTETLKKLSKRQAIVTLNEHALDKVKGKIKAHIINTKIFKLKNC